MPPRSKEERLFGAACLRAQLEKSGASRSGVSGIYEGALNDLGLSDDEVRQFLELKRDQVDKALSQGTRKDSAKASQ